MAQLSVSGPSMALTFFFVAALDREPLLALVLADDLEGICCIDEPSVLTIRMALEFLEDLLNDRALILQGSLGPACD